MKSLGSEIRALDATDVRLLKALVTDARTSIAKLARLVGLSSPSVAERIRRLEDDGIIEGYSARINPAALGLPLAAWLRIRPIPGKYQSVAEAVKDIPEIVECDRVTGDDCLVARAHVRSVDALERLIDKIVPNAMTNTSIIQSSPVERRIPPLKPV